MDTEIILRHNEMVEPKDVVIHAGDFTLSKKHLAENYTRQLNGTHIFLKGSHDYWLKKSATVIWERELGSKFLFCSQDLLVDFFLVLQIRPQNIRG